jgi:hypothetical protein
MWKIREAAEEEEKGMCPLCQEEENGVHIVTNCAETRE